MLIIGIVTIDLHRAPNIVHKPIGNNACHLFLLIASLMVGCASPHDAGDLARRHALPLRTLQSGGFQLPVLGQITPDSQGRLRVYLPGDGIPWRGRVPASNPTGRRHLALELMQRDPEPALLLGRPCYLQRHLDADCEPALWTMARYSRPIIEALDRALEQLIEQTRPDSLLLVGYSGGGTLAVLLAARQALPTTVITVAANLDTRAWTRHHRHLPLSTSLNPAFDISPGSGFRQIHFMGERDSVVPPETLHAYRQRHPDATYRVEAGYDHHCCWVETWPTLLQRALGD